MNLMVIVLYLSFAVSRIQGEKGDTEGKLSAVRLNSHTTNTTGSALKNRPANAGGAGDSSSIPGPGRSPGEGNGNPLQYSCLENPMDGGAWQATKVHKRSDTTKATEHAHTKELSNFTREARSHPQPKSGKKTVKSG